MSTLTICIVVLFCIGYFCIAFESVTKINKAAIALLMFVGCWTLFMFDPASYIAAAVGDMKASAVSEVIEPLFYQICYDASQHTQWHTSQALQSGNG